MPAAIAKWLDPSTITRTLADTESLLGLLQFGTHVVPNGRPYLYGLVRFLGMHASAAATRRRRSHGRAFEAVGLHPPHRSPFPPRSSLCSPAPGDSFAAFSSSVIAATYLAATTARAPRTAPPVSAVSASNRRRFHPNLAPSPFSLSAVPSASRFAACRPSAAAQTFAGLEDEKLAFAASTRAGYGTGLGHFLSWCEDNGIDEQLRCPASEELLTRFVAAQAGHFSGDYHAKMISAVGAWHKTYGVP
ncbi:unnamed protein product [Tilletia controversa]|nr:unnamed protein product [Tilletia controversa]